MVIGAEPLFLPVEAKRGKDFLNEVLGNWAWDHLTNLKEEENEWLFREKAN